MLAIHPNRRGARRICTGLLPLLAILMSTAAGAATITVTSTDDVVDRGEPCTLLEAIRVANGTADSNLGCKTTMDNKNRDRIIFSDAIANASEQTTPIIVLQRDKKKDKPGLKITESLIIDGTIQTATELGQGTNTTKVILDAEGNQAHPNRIFNIKDPKPTDKELVHVTLKNLTLRDGYIKGGNGGLILLGKMGNTPKLTIHEVLLKHGVATDSSEGSGFGGAIYVASGTLMIEKSTIDDNTADRGGGIGASANTVKITIKNSLLSQNLASADTANPRGGHIYVKDATLKIIDSTLIIGEALTAHSKYEAAGGAIFMDGGKLIIKRSLLQQNFAETKGGALALRNQATAKITNTVFKANGFQTASAGEHIDVTKKGGAIYAQKAKVTMAHGALIGNEAAIEGGAIWAKRSSISMTDVEVRANTAGGVQKSTSGGVTNGKGGAIYYADSDCPFTHCKLDIEDSLLIGNVAYGNKGAGGAIYNNSARVVISDSRLTRNKALHTGGAIHTVGTAATVIIKASILGGNTPRAGNSVGTAANPGKGGGAIYIDGSTVKIRHSTVSYNSATQGGGIWNGLGGRLKIFGSTISHNKATGDADLPGGKDGYGGGIYGDAEVHFSTIAYNSAAYAGGGIANPSDSVDIFNSIVANNSAPIQDNIAAANIRELKRSGSNVIAPSAGLRSLQFSAGALVHPLLPNSDAVDATNRKNRPSPLQGDQRGVKCQGDCDAGSFEYNNDLPTIKVTPNIPPGSDTELVGQSNVAVFAVALTNTTNAPITITGFSLEPRGGVINTLLSVIPEPDTLYVIKDGDGDGMLDKREDTVLASKPLGTFRPFSIDCTPKRSGNVGCQLNGGDTLDLLVTLRPPIENEAVASSPSAAVYAGGGMLLGLIAILSLTSVRRRTRLLMALAVITIGLTACSNADGPPPPFPTNSHFRLVAVQAKTTTGTEVVVTQGVPLNGPDIYVRLQDR